MPIVEQWSKPDRKFSDNIIYEYTDKKTGRIIRQAEDGKNFSDYYFQDNWEPVAYYDLQEHRYVGINESVKQAEEANKAIEKAAANAADVPPEKKDSPESAPPPPPAAVPAPVETPTQQTASSTSSECPCGMKVTDGDKNILNFGFGNNIYKDPNGTAISQAKSLLGSNSSILDNILTGNYFDAASGVLPALQSVKAKITGTQQIVSKFEQESNKFKDPKYLAGVVSSLNMFANMSCALGIDGVDVTGGLNVVNHNGKYAIEYSGNVQANLDQLLRKISGGDTGSPQFIKDAQSQMENISKAMDDANAQINKVVDSANALQTEAANYIDKFTSINFFSNLINDPCHKLGGTVKGNLLSPEFINVVKTNSQTPLSGATSVR